MLPLLLRQPSSTGEKNLQHNFRGQELRRNAVKQPTINDVIIAAVEVADEENSTDLENEADYNETSDNTNKAETSLDSATEDEDKEIDVRTQLE